MAAQLTQVVSRICERVVPTIPLEVTPLDTGGVRIRTGMGDHPTWVANHTMLRELRLVGWEVTTDGDGLLVLGWSAANLSHRIQALRISITGLGDCLRTVAAAVAATESYLAAFPAASSQEALTATLARIEVDHLHWPIRVRELADLERTSSNPLLDMLMRRNADLEQRVLQLCEQHLASAATAVKALCDFRDQPRLGPDDARYAALDDAATVLRYGPIGACESELGRAS
ncbi:hypothetical protein ACQPYK_49345 (plasmid) [Streptosporangium sp. CA-135522]|uniref:hypothetical protein n=1 Tax=Streptosporangium sp. CA-135522 TaxID=3240072 RepID=UPI003D8B8B4A